MEPSSTSVGNDSAPPLHSPTTPPGCLTGSAAPTQASHIARDGYRAQALPTTTSVSLSSTSDDETAGGTGAVLPVDIDMTKQVQKGEFVDRRGEDEVNNKVTKEQEDQCEGSRCRRACAKPCGHLVWVARRCVDYAHSLDLDRGQVERRCHMEIVRQLCLFFGDGQLQ